VGAGGVTPLLVAAEHGYWRVGRALLSSVTPPDPNQALPDGTTPLIVAAECGHAEFVQLMLAAGAASDQPLTDGTTALFMAAQEVSARDAWLRTLVHLAGGLIWCRCHRYGALLRGSSSWPCTMRRAPSSCAPDELLIGGSCPPGRGAVTRRCVLCVLVRLHCRATTRWCGC
jgi:hypothetical protein